jgi:hypothetical protein
VIATMADDARNPFSRYAVELLLLLGALVAALVFVLRPGARTPKPATPTPPTTGVSASNSAPSGPVSAASVKIPSMGRSPTRPVFGSLPFTDEDRSRQLNMCMGRARNAPTYPVDGVGEADLAHTGVVGDSLVFDGTAQNVTTGRRLVWRCAIGNWDGRVGGSRFTTLEAINGVPLEWNAIATIDDDVLRKCVVKAMDLFPGREVPPFPLGGRRGDSIQLTGVATGAGNFRGDWKCDARLDQGRIASLDVQTLDPQ